MRPRVLVVDDVPEILAFVEDALAALRPVAPEVVTARRVEAALSHLARERFDLVLSDRRVGADDGLRVVAEARRRGSACILMTAYDGAPGDAVAVAAAGVEATLAKPFAAVHVRRMVAQRLAAGTAAPLRGPSEFTCGVPCAARDALL